MVGCEVRHFRFHLGNYMLVDTDQIYIIGLMGWNHTKTSFSDMSRRLFVKRGFSMNAKNVFLLKRKV